MNKLLIFLLFAAGIATGCSRQNKSAFIAVTIEPQRYFAEKIAGSLFHIYTVVPPGQDPETYDATPRQMLQFNRCAAYLSIGNMAFEQVWIQNILKNNPDMKTFNLSEGFPFLEAEDAEHNHHPGNDPHIWSSIQGAKTMAKNTLDAITALDRNNEALYRQNFNTLMKEINDTDSVIKSKTANLNSRAFIIYHPALTYFAKEYNLRQFCIETEGKEPSPAGMKSLIDAVKQYNARVIFVQPEYDRNNLRILAEAANCKMMDINLMSYEWSKEMINVANALADEQ